MVAGFKRIQLPISPPALPLLPHMRFFYAHLTRILLQNKILTYTPVLVAGLPLDQKVVQYGPFVLNTQDEVYQALMDFQTHSNGFERAKGWKSEIGKTMAH